MEIEIKKVANGYTVEVYSENTGRNIFIYENYLEVVVKINDILKGE